MKKEELLPMLKAYQQRYGEASMGVESMKMWWEALKDFDVVHVGEAMDYLIGKHEFKFGHNRVADYIHAKHPNNDSVKEVKGWSKIKDNKTDAEKQDEVNKLVSKIVSRNERIKLKGGEPYDWITELKDEFFRVFGKSESRKICEKMRMGSTTATMDKFINMVIREA